MLNQWEMEMQVYPNASILPKGSKVTHVVHGDCVVVKTQRKFPFTVWVKMDSDGIVGTVDIRLLRWRE